MEKSRQVLDTGQAMKHVGIPAKTKCCICKRVKHTNQFSTKQLDELRLRIRKQGQANAVPKEGLIRCRDCSGSQNTQMKCTMCLKVKLLEGFSLAQRSKKDDAICLQCHEELDETHADDRKLTTAHDGTLAYNRDINDVDDDDASTSAASESADIWLWDRETGDYATEGSSTIQSDNGVALPRSNMSVTASEASQMSIRPWTRIRRPERPQPSVPKSDGPALTRKNLAKLTVSDKASSGKGNASSSSSESDSSSSSSLSEDDNATTAAAGVPLRSKAGNRTSSRQLSPAVSDGGSDDGSDGSSSHAGPLFRAFDPSGALHMQHRRPSTGVSVTPAGTGAAGPLRHGGTASAWHGRKYAPLGGDAAAKRAEDTTGARGFARVRPQNPPRPRRYVDGDVPAPALLPASMPSRTGINTGVMDDVSSDEN